MSDVQQLRPTVNYMRYLKGIHDTKRKPYETAQEMLSNAVDALFKKGDFAEPRIDIFTVYKATQSILMVVDNGSGMDIHSIQNMFSFDSSNKDARDNNGEKGRGKGKIFTEANYLFAIVTKTAAMHNYVSVISNDIWSAVGAGEIPVKCSSLEAAINDIESRLLMYANVKTREGIRALLRQLRSRMDANEAGTLVMVACDDRYMGDDGKRNLPFMQTKALLKHEDAGWEQNETRLQARETFANRKIYTRKLPVVIRYVCAGGSNIYHSNKVNLAGLKDELDALAERMDMTEVADRFWETRVTMRPAIWLHTTTDPRGVLLESGYPVESNAIAMGPAPFVTSTNNIGTVTLLVSRTSNWTRENEPLGRNNKYQRCNINYTEMTGVQLRSMGVLKGKLYKAHSREFYEALPVGAESGLEQSVQDNYLLLDEHGGGIFTYNLVLDVSQDDIPASSERGTYSAASFTAFLGSDNVDCMRQIAGILQRFATDNAALRECFAQLDQAQKEGDERDGAARDEERLRVLQNGERYRLLAHDPEDCVWSPLLGEAFKVPQTEKELEEDYFMWERWVWERREHLGQRLPSLWYKSLCAPSKGSDRLCYDRFQNPTLAHALNTNTVDLTDESVRCGFKAVEFKKQLVNDMRINHPLDSLDCIIVTELPAHFEQMRDEKRFVCEVKERHPTYLVLGNIHRNDDQGNATTPLGQSTMNLKKIIVIGFMELLRESTLPHAALERFLPTQKPPPASKAKPKKRGRGA